MDTPAQPDSDAIASFCSQVTRHRTLAGGEWFAIHDVYFRADGTVATYTVHALSPKAETVEQLKNTILELIAHVPDGGTVACGELGYEYEKEDLQDWLDYLHYPPIDYEDDYEE